MLLRTLLFSDLLHNADAHVVHHRKQLHQISLELLFLQDYRFYHILACSHYRNHSCRIKNYDVQNHDQYESHLPQLDHTKLY